MEQSVKSEKQTRKYRRKAKVTLTARVDGEAKEKAEEIYERLGFNLSQAVNIFIFATVEHGGFPFSLTLLDRKNEPAVEQKPEPVQPDPFASSPFS